MTLYSHTPLNDALRLSPSVIEAFFDSKPFGDWRKAREAEGKIKAGVCDRLNEVIRGEGIIAKTIAKTGRL